LGSIALGGLIGFFIGMVRSRQRIAELSNALNTERQLNSERLAGMKDTFAAIASDALQQNNEGFLTLAKETFGRYQDGAANELEKRQKAIEELVNCSAKK
jgi:DNA recombination protein RmuC